MDYARISLTIFVVMFTAAAAYIDWKTRKLPNVLTVSFFVAGLLFHLIHGAVTGGWSGAFGELLFALKGFGVGFGILLPLWLIGGGGAGDVKLFGALGAWLGAWLTFKVFIAGTIFVVIGGIVVLTGVFFTKGYQGVIGRLKSGQAVKKKKAKGQDVSEDRSKRRLVPFGVPAAFATWLMLAAEFLIQKP